MFQAITSNYTNSLIIFPLIQKFNRIGSQKKKSENPVAIIELYLHRYEF